MAKKTFESIGYHYAGPESDGFCGKDSQQPSFGISRLVELTSGISAIDDLLDHHIRMAVKDKTYKNQYIVNIAKEELDNFRKKSGKEFPDLIKVKITVETEVLPVEESKKFWLEKQQQSIDRQKEKQ